MELRGRRPRRQELGGGGGGGGDGRRMEGNDSSILLVVGDSHSNSISSNRHKKTTKFVSVSINRFIIVFWIYGYWENDEIQFQKSFRDFELCGRRFGGDWVFHSHGYSLCTLFSDDRLPHLLDLLAHLFARHSQHGAF